MAPSVAGIITGPVGRGLAIGMAGVGAAAGVIPLLFGAFLGFIPEEHIYVRTIGKRRCFRTVRDVSFDLVRTVEYKEVPAVEYRVDGSLRHFTQVKEIVRHKRTNVVVTKRKELRRAKRHVVFKVPGIFPGLLIDLREATSPFRDPDDQAIITGKSEGTDGRGVQHVLDLQLAWRFGSSDESIGQAHFTKNDPYRLVVQRLWPRVLAALAAHTDEGLVPFEAIMEKVIAENQDDILEELGIFPIRLSQQVNAVTPAEMERQARVEAATIDARGRVEAARVAATITADGRVEAARIAAAAQLEAARIIANGSLHSIDGHSQGTKAKGVAHTQV